MPQPSYVKQVLESMPSEAGLYQRRVETEPEEARESQRLIVHLLVMYLRAPAATVKAMV